MQYHPGVDGDYAYPHTYYTSLHSKTADVFFEAKTVALNFTD